MVRNILHELYSICRHCNMEVYNEDHQEHVETYHADAEDASETHTCPHGRVVSPAICRRYHED